MSDSIFMSISEVAEAMGISESYAYKIVRELNKDLRAKGYIALNGKIDRKFFYDQFYSTKNN